MRLLLVRHALCDPVDVRLAGRAAGVSLNAAGRAQLGPLVARMTRRLDGTVPDAVLASPLARTQETALAVAAPYHLVVTAEPALIELDVGRWTGETFDALHADPEWRGFNQYRSGTPAGGAELQLEVQVRAATLLLGRARATPDATIVAVTHGDVVKALAGYWMGVPIDLQHRLEVAPTSVTEIHLHPWGPRIVALNDVS